MKFNYLNQKTHRIEISKIQRMGLEMRIDYSTSVDVLMGLCVIFRFKIL